MSIFLWDGRTEQLQIDSICFRYRGQAKQFPRDLTNPQPGRVREVSINKIFPLICIYTLVMWGAAGGGADVAMAAVE